MLNKVGSIKGCTQRRRQQGREAIDDYEGGSASHGTRLVSK